MSTQPPAMIHALYAGSIAAAFALVWLFTQSSTNPLRMLIGAIALGALALTAAAVAVGVSQGNVAYREQLERDELGS